MERKSIIEGQEYAAVLRFPTKQNASPADYSYGDVTRVRVVKIHPHTPRGVRVPYGSERNRVVEVKLIEDFDHNATAKALDGEDYLTTRRIIVGWDEYVAARKERDTLQERLTVERAEKFETDTALADLFRRRQVAVGLTKPHDGKPLFTLSPDQRRGTVALYFHGSYADIEALLTRLEN